MTRGKERDQYDRELLRPERHRAHDRPREEGEFLRSIGWRYDEVSGAAFAGLSEYGSG